MIHPHVQQASQAALEVLKKRKIPHRLFGGLAVNAFAAGRPAKDVELIVPREKWEEAIEALRDVAASSLGIRFGVPGEPGSGLGVVGPHGVSIEVWPEGLSHEDIAKTRGKHRKNNAGKLTLTLKGEEIVALINNKLASYLCATDRIKDLADVQALISKLNLPLNFSEKLAPEVRTQYIKIWKGKA